MLVVGRLGEALDSEDVRMCEVRAHDPDHDDPLHQACMCSVKVASC
jgi:hypothetical protein